MTFSKTKLVALSLVIGCVGLGIGIIIGYFGIQESVPTENESIHKKLMKEISNERIEQNLWDITRKPHIAGRDTDEKVLVERIKNDWENAGLDSVVVHPYDVLLSYPLQSDSNYVALLDKDGNEYEVSQKKELVIDEEQNDPDVVNPFNAYSAPGTPSGDLVYVNYGTIDDFIELNRNVGISTSGKVCISRYGKIFRGDKAKHAEQYGCLGLILYSDPADYTVPWAGVYPSDWYLPPTGAQRGTLWVENGDPRTPNYPSISSAWHMSEMEIPLPKIPVTPIGYGDAWKYLEKLGGAEVPESWRGDLNITYRYGPGFNSHTESKIKMYVKTKNQAAIIHNVVGYIQGGVEPDRYVIFGNHRDAWVFGAIDPSSGTAVLMEMVRAFGKMVKQGWRPRRTLVFCSWGAEEYGLIGSTEWVEEFQKELQSRTVAYLNVDSAVNGNFTFRGSGVSSLRDVVFEAAKLVDNPDSAEVAAGRSTVYDTWKLKLADNDNLDIPYFGGLGSGSDYATFLQVIGICSIDLRYVYDYSTDLGSYPVYHSVYETFELVSKFVDPDFKFHQAVGRVWAEVGRKLSDSVVLPINCRLYAKDLQKKEDSLITEFGEKMSDHGIDLKLLQDAIQMFATAAEKIHNRADALKPNDFYANRALNDQLMQLERAFIDVNPLPGRISYRHVISAPSLHNNYGNTAFPGLVDAMFDIDADPDQEGRWDEVRRQYSILVFHILSAASTLGPVTLEQK
ncbi:unnamed protein product [Clavelina lepadiformis]|uniref:Uncharacterized protein n=1 Tax=Clavelina lepadiformis TaxID=159417 RepID=A0ABP0GN92_CLALP